MKEIKDRHADWVYQVELERAPPIESDANTSGLSFSLCESR